MNSDRTQQPGLRRHAEPNYKKREYLAITRASSREMKKIISSYENVVYPLGEATRWGKSKRRSRRGTPTKKVGGVGKGKGGVGKAEWGKKKTQQPWKEQPRTSLPYNHQGQTPIATLQKEATPCLHQQQTGQSIDILFTKTSFKNLFFPRNAICPNRERKTDRQSVKYVRPG